MTILASKDIRLASQKLCPACGGSKRTRLFKITASEVFRCMECGLKYLDPCLSEGSMSAAYESGESLKSFHDFHEGYYDYGELSQKSKTRDDFQEGLLRLEKHLSPGQPRKILDVGYGNGFFLAVARQRGWQVDGIDTSAENRKIAKARFGLQLRSGGFEQDIPNDQTYGAVAFWDVIEHLANPHRTLQKVRRILKPGGLVLIALPNDQNLLMIIASFLYKITAGVFNFGLKKLYFLEHVCYYEQKSLNALLEKNRFVNQDYFFTNTDLAKYRLPRWEKIVAGTLLQIGHWLRLDNRLVVIYQIL